MMEETFVKTFVKRDRRESWLTRLASPKTRAKQVHRLAHSFDRDLDQRFMYDKARLAPQIATQVEQLLVQWKRANALHGCHIIAVSSERDGQTMPLEGIETDFFLTFGAVIIIIPDKLAYFHTERSNLNQPPCYVLFRP